MLNTRCAVAGVDMVLGLLAAFCNDGMPFQCGAGHTARGVLRSKKPVEKVGFLY